MHRRTRGLRGRAPDRRPGRPRCGRTGGGVDARSARPCSSSAGTGQLTAEYLPARERCSAGGDRGGGGCDSRLLGRMRPGPPSNGRCRARRSLSTSGTATAGPASTRTRATRLARTASGSTRSRASTSRTVLRRGVGSTTFSSRPTRSCSSTTCATRSGNSEPGLAEGTEAHVDRSGSTTTPRASSARARGRSSPRRTSGPPTTSGRCSASQASIEQIWRASPNSQRQHDSPSRATARRASPSASTPTGPSGGFYRSLVSQRRELDPGARGRDRHDAAAPTAVAGSR